MAQTGILVCVPKSEQRPLLTRESRPPEFVKKPTYVDDSEDDESIVGKMPPAEESDSGE